MLFFSRIRLRFGNFIARIYWILSIIGWVLGLAPDSHAQQTGDYRTISSGSFQDIAIWETYDGTSWIPPTSTPGQQHDIYIEAGTTLTLQQDESVRSLYINAETGAGQKLNLNSFNLTIYGTLQGYSGAAPGTPSRAWNSTNWIGNSLTSRLTFRGTSRTIIPRGTWSAQSGRSRFSVIFDPGPGQILRIEEAFKSLSFTLRSGTLIQTLDVSSTLAQCATFSFNTETALFGAGPFGELIIEAGAQLISECNQAISFRSASSSSALFWIQEGGELILEGEQPLIETAEFRVEGKITHRGGTTPKAFLSSSFPDAGQLSKLHDLELQGDQNLSFPAELAVTGDLIQSGSGRLLTQNSHLSFTGTGEQSLVGFSLQTQSLTLAKPSGSLNSQNDLEISETLHMLQGRLDLGGNELNVNTSGSGGYVYQEGLWKNIRAFTFHSSPVLLSPTNATFPFEDSANGGGRRFVQLLGETSGGDLRIDFQEYMGADHFANFSDHDGTPILYRLYSFFQFSGLSPSAQSLEMRISADELIVDDENHLRLVGSGYAAPGNHLPGLDPDWLWARRYLPISALEKNEFTIGSTHTLSVLPLNFLSFSVTRTAEGHVMLDWTVNDEKPGTYTLFQSYDPLHTWTKIGQIGSTEETAGQYHFEAPQPQIFTTSYYHIRYEETESGRISQTEVRHLAPWKIVPEHGLLYPNPYSSGSLSLVLPNVAPGDLIWVTLSDQKGVIIWEERTDQTSLLAQLQQQESGIYILRIVTESQDFLFRWVKM